MRTADFDYHLPPELIAQHPVRPRDRSRLMVVDRGAGTLSHRVFADLPDLLRRGDRMVVNDTTVLPARLYGTRRDTGGRWEGLFLGFVDERDEVAVADLDGRWRFLCKTRGTLRAGERIVLEDGATGLTVVGRGGDGEWLLRPADDDIEAFSLLDRLGHMPLPPYVRKGRDEPADRRDYQTPFGRDPGAVAAPTASLHFTPDLLARLEQAGVQRSRVTLHVGVGTFRPVQVENPEDHPMHAEFCRVTWTTANDIGRTQAAGGRIVAVGTTVARTLEAAAATGPLEPFAGQTRLFLRPGSRFHVVDALITNFHLPRSTLLMLVAALAGTDLIRRAYDTAVRERYRFYSYGDAMLIL